jgi:hypothetical protein
MMKLFFIYFLGFLSITVGFSNPAVSQALIDMEGENVLVHSDRNFYISGQTMWFKIYVTEKNSYKLQTLSKTAYVELIGPDGKAVSQAKIELHDGLGAGSFLLPDGAKSGNYELRAYTNRMKNNPSTVFKKAFILVNTQHNFDTTALVLIGKDSENDAKPASNSGNIFTSQKADNRPYILFPIKIETDKQNYEPRRIVNLEVQPANQEKDFSANISVAVYKANALTTPEKTLTRPNSGTFYTDSIIKDGQAFLPEMNGFVVVARVRDLAGKPVANVPLNLSLAGKLAQLRWGESDEKGLVYVNFKNVYGPQQIFVNTSHNYEGKVQIDLLKSFPQPQKTEPLPKAIFKNSFLEIVEEMHNNLQVSKTFEAGAAIPFIVENRDSISFYGKAHKTYLLDNYKRFVTMEEVLREYVQEVSVRIRNGNYSILMLSKQLVDLSRYLRVDKMMDNFHPLVLIDGIPVTPNKLMKYDPLKVRKLEVFGERYYLGQNIYDGILSFTTFTGNFEDLSLEKDDLVAEEQGWQYKRTFFMPDYKNLQLKNNRLPDFRELLYWEPQINLHAETPAKLSFYTGDLTGEFLVEVHGITTDGRIIHEVKSLEIK